MADFLISGEAQIGKVEQALGSLSGLIPELEKRFNSARSAVINLADATENNSPKMREAYVNAKAALQGYTDLLNNAAKAGTIEKIGDKTKASLAVLNQSFKESEQHLKAHQEQVKAEDAVFAKLSRDYVRGAKEIESAERRRERAQSEASRNARKEAIAAAKGIVEQDRLVEKSRRDLVASTRKAQQDEEASQRKRAKAAKEAAREAKEAMRDEEAEARKLRQSLNSLFGVYAGNSIRRFIQDSVDAAVSMERIRKSLDAATGSLEQGAEAFAYTRELAYKLGLDIETLSKQYGLFLAATNESGFSLKQQKAIFESVAEATRVLGLSTEDMQGVFVALSQIATKGTVQMEELRQQLGDRLPGALRIMATALGIPQKELFKLTKDGLVPAQEALVLFQQKLREKLVDPTFESSLDSLQTKIGQLRNALFEVRAEFGKAFATQVTGDLDVTNKKLSETKDTANALGTGFGFVAAALTTAVSKIVSGGRVIVAVIQGIVGTVEKSINGVVEKISSGIANRIREAANAARALGIDELADKLEKVEKVFRAGADAARDAGKDAKYYAEAAKDIYDSQLDIFLGRVAGESEKVGQAHKRTTLSAKELAETHDSLNEKLGLSKKAESDFVDELRKEVSRQYELKEGIDASNEARSEGTEKLTDQQKQLREMAKEIIKEREAIEGSVESLTRRTLVHQEAIRLAEQDGKVTPAAAEEIKKKNGELFDSYQKMGVEVPQYLQAIFDKYGALSARQQQFIDALDASLSKIEERYSKAEDAARNASGEKFGEFDLNKVRSEISDLQSERSKAVNNLLGSSDAESAKRAQKEIDRLDKQIEDRKKRLGEIKGKIDEQNKADNAGPQKEVEDLQKRATDLRKTVSELEGKQNIAGLSPDELAKLFEAKDALTETNIQLRNLGAQQQGVADGWSGIADEEDAATKAWEEYYTLVEKNAIEQKRILAEQESAISDIGDSAEGAAVKWDASTRKLNNVTGNWTSSLKEIDGVLTNIGDEGTVAIETLADGTKKMVNNTSDLSEKAAEASEAVQDLGTKGAAGIGAVASSAGDAATEAERIEAAMIRINERHIPDMVKGLEGVSALMSGMKLGGGGGGSVPTRGLTDSQNSGGQPVDYS